MASGEGGSALAAGVLALIQDPAGKPRFPVAAFLGIMAGVMLCSLVALIVLLRSGRAAGSLAQPRTADMEDNLFLLEAESPEPMKGLPGHDRVALFVLFLGSLVSNGIMPSISTYHHNIYLNEIDNK